MHGSFRSRALGDVESELDVGYPFFMKITNATTSSTKATVQLRWEELSDAELTRLDGGLEASSVVLIEPRSRTRRGRLRLIAKRVAGRASREGAIYENLRHTSHRIAPRLFSVEHLGRGQSILYLEALEAPATWPWRDLGTVSRVLEHAARLHTTIRVEEVHGLPEWDYEADLVESGRSIVDLLASIPHGSPLASLRPAIPALRRLVLSARDWRAHLLGLPLLGRCLIHGDLHTGNVLFRERGRHRGPVLIDWGRSRIGSPLEDVSSWLQSLGYWEPVARRKHDTLLARYLVFRGVESGLSEELRTAYWLAGASNALAGALEHHVRQALGTEDPGERQRALAAARDWLRILRRADARWTCTFATRPCQRLNASGRARRESGRLSQLYRLGAREKVHRSRVEQDQGRTLLAEQTPTRSATP